MCTASRQAWAGLGSVLTPCRDALCTFSSCCEPRNLESTPSRGLLPGAALARCSEQGLGRQGWAHLQIHSNPAKSCSTHCFEICTVLWGVKDLLRVSLHLLTYMKTKDRGFDVFVKEYAVIVQQHLHTDPGYRQAGFQRAQ